MPDNLIATISQNWYSSYQMIANFVFNYLNNAETNYINYEMVVLSNISVLTQKNI